MRRVLIVLGLLLLALPGWAEDYIRYHPPMGGTISVPLLGAAADNCAAVPYSFTGDTNTGVCSSAADTVGLIAGGTTRISTTTTAVTSTVPIVVNNQATLTSDAANILAQRNTTNAQTFNLYSTYTDGSNYRRSAFTMDSGNLYIKTENAGTGGVGFIYIQPATNTLFWSGSLLPATTDVGGIGSSSYYVPNLYLTRSIQGSKSKALADATATAFVRLTVADDDYEGCSVGWTAYAEDADTDARQVRKGRTNVAILNNGGTEACNFSASADDEAILVTAGTLTCAFDCAAGTNTVDLRANCDTSLDAAAETLTFEYRLDCESAITTVTPQ